MSNPVQTLKDFAPARDFFIGIDSDGCVFDTMEIKHKECFTPMFIKYFHLQAVSKFAREVWDFVNLYSKTRGMNRFPALVRALHLLADRPQVISRGLKLWNTSPLEDWIQRETKLGNATLRTEVENGNRQLEPVLSWSTAVNQSIEDLVHDVPPFPFFRECLSQMNARADVIVVSQTPTEALVREWTEHHIQNQVRFLAGQELGTKTEHLQFAAHDKYPPEKILMIGDAPGDFNAAKANGASFFPINPGNEESSWKRLHDEALDRFFNGTYAGDYQSALLQDFNDCLPEHPSWMT
jgi:phosphoglycolate phosphatase-like HAD superfamily hydrolase